MIQHGKYQPADKLRMVCALWEKEVAGPGCDETDRHGRMLVPKWASYALSAGRAAVYDRTRECLDTMSHQSIEEIINSHRHLIASLNPTECRDASVLRVCEAFKRGALRILEYTEDDDEIPSLALLRTRSLAYPVQHLAGQQSAAAFGVAAFLGRNDVVYIFDAGIPKVTLVDIDERGLGMMKLIYPSHWEYITSGYQEYLGGVRDAGDRYDVVACDLPLWTAEDVAWTHGREFLDLCNRYFITNYTGEMLAQVGFGTDNLATLSARISERMKAAGRVVGLYPRIVGQRHHWVVIAKA